MLCLWTEEIRELSAIFIIFRLTAPACRGRLGSPATLQNRSSPWEIDEKLVCRAIYAKFRVSSVSLKIFLDKGPHSRRETFILRLLSSTPSTETNALNCSSRLSRVLNVSFCSCSMPSRLSHISLIKLPMWSKGNTEKFRLSENEWRARACHLKFEQ